MATHGRGGLTRLIMGSVAVATLQKAGVPLLLMRPGMAVPKGTATVAMIARASRALIAPQGVTSPNDLPDP